MRRFDKAKHIQRLNEKLNKKKSTLNEFHDAFKQDCCKKGNGKFGERDSAPLEEESNRKHDEVDAAMAKLGIALTVTGTATHAVRVDDQLRVFRGSYEEAEMAAQKLSTILNDKTIKVVDLQQSF
jgi:uncharacterized protein (UPF0216 family)